jgi:lactate permease
VLPRTVYDGQLGDLGRRDPARAGGNVGNSLAPVVITIGVIAVGNATTISAVLRRTIWPALVLLGSVLANTLVLAALHR